MAEYPKFFDLPKAVTFTSVIDGRLDEIEKALLAKVSLPTIYEQLCKEGWEQTSFVTFKSTLQKSRVKRAALLKLIKKGSK